MGNSDRQVLLISLAEWHAFAERFAEKHVFHHAGWIQSLIDTYHFPLRVYAVKDLGTGEILTALPFMRVTTIRGKRKWVCLPFTDHFPILGDQDELIKMVKYLRSEHILEGEIEIRCELPQDDDFHYSTGQVRHMLNLETDQETLLAAVAKNHRKALRQGAHRGTSVEKFITLEAVKTFYKLQLRVRRAKGLPTQPWKLFLQLHENLIANGHGYIALAANQEKTPMAGKVVLFWGKTITGKFGASDYEYLHYRPNHCVYWQTLIWALDQGFHWFDFGKTTLDNEGLCEFKEGWSAVEVPLCYTYLGILEDVNLVQPAESGLLRIVSFFIRKGPLWFSRFIGQLFYRYFT